MTSRVTLMSLNTESYKSPSRMTEFSGLPKNNITNIMVLNSTRASLIMSFDTS